MPPIRRSGGQPRGEGLAQERVGCEGPQQNSERVLQPVATRTRSRDVPNIELSREEEDNNADEEEKDEGYQAANMYLLKEGFDMTRWPHKSMI